MITASPTRAASASIEQSRRVERLITGASVTDGAGVRINRVLTHQLQRRLDPFLMLDQFGSDKPGDYIAGFPEHPHRGFETVTYMLHGSMRHKDSFGNEGVITDGGVQWMTAGRGVAHSEMPEQTDGLMEGFQLWLNLPASHKMRAPWYADIPAADLPHVHTEAGVDITVIAGETLGVAGAVQREVTEPLYLDIHLPAGATHAQPLPTGHNAFVYVYRGSAQVAGSDVGAGQLAILANDESADGVTLSAAADAKLILVAGRPLNEPIAQYGPFVMNTEAEIHQAIEDFRAGRFRA